MIAHSSGPHIVKTVTPPKDEIKPKVRRRHIYGYGPINVDKQPRVKTGARPADKKHS